jgi:hypothetical protein
MKSFKKLVGNQKSSIFIMCKYMYGNKKAKPGLEVRGSSRDHIARLSSCVSVDYIEGMGQEYYHL